MEKFAYIDAFGYDDDRYECYLLPAFRYEELKVKAAAIVAQYFVGNMPIDVFALGTALGIRFVPFISMTIGERVELAEIGITSETDGFYTLVRTGEYIVPYIYYNDSKDVHRIRFTILHEIAHIILGHREHSDLAEAEANFFAKYLIAPPELVDIIQPNDYMDVARVFEISHQCAMYSFNFYEKWKRHYMRAGMVYTDYEKTIIAVCGEGILRRKYEVDNTF